MKDDIHIDENGNKIETEGSIEIKGKEFKVFTQSNNVFKKILNKLQKNIGKHLELIKEEIKPVDDALKDYKEDRQKPAKKRKTRRRMARGLENNRYLSIESP